LRYKPEEDRREAAAGPSSGLAGLVNTIRDRPCGETMNQLWGRLDDPHMNQALGLPARSRPIQVKQA
jgi:hypothetical protein